MLKEKYSFKEIIEAQKRPLEEKISLSVEVLRKAYKLSRHNVAIAFSGGKDSTVVADLIERFLPEEFSRTFCIFGNTGVEFPESLKFARSYGNNHFGVRFKETKPLELQEPELRYNFAREIVNQLEKENALDEVLKSDGKLKSQKALINAAKRRGYVLDRSNCFKVGTKMTFA